MVRSAHLRLARVGQGLAAVCLRAEAGIVLDYRLGVILTALLIGGGAGLIYDIFTDQGQPKLPGLEE